MESLMSGIFILFGVVASIVFVVIICSIIRVFSQHKKMVDDQVKNVFGAILPEEPKEKKIPCEYCGQENSEKNTNCACCGAKIKKK